MGERINCVFMNIGIDYWTTDKTFDPYVNDSVLVHLANIKLEWNELENYINGSSGLPSPHKKDYIRAFGQHCIDTIDINPWINRDISKYIGMIYNINTNLVSMDTIGIMEARKILQNYEETVKYIPERIDESLKGICEILELDLGCDVGTINEKLDDITQTIRNICKDTTVPEVKLPNFKKNYDDVKDVLENINKNLAIYEEKLAISKEYNIFLNDINNYFYFLHDLKWLYSGEVDAILNYIKDTTETVNNINNIIDEKKIDEEELKKKKEIVDELTGIKMNTEDASGIIAETIRGIAQIKPIEMYINEITVKIGEFKETILGIIVNNFEALKLVTDDVSKKISIIQSEFEKVESDILDYLVLIDDLYTEIKLMDKHLIQSTYECNIYGYIQDTFIVPLNELIEEYNQKTERLYEEHSNLICSINNLQKFFKTCESMFKGPLEEIKKKIDEVEKVDLDIVEGRHKQWASTKENIDFYYNITNIKDAVVSRINTMIVDYGYDDTNTKRVGLLQNLKNKVEERLDKMDYSALLEISKYERKKHTKTNIQRGGSFPKCTEDAYFVELIKALYSISIGRFIYEKKAEKLHSFGETFINLTPNITELLNYQNSANESKTIGPIIEKIGELIRRSTKELSNNKNMLHSQLFKTDVSQKEMKHILSTERYETYPGVSAGGDSDYPHIHAFSGLLYIFTKLLSNLPSEYTLLQPGGGGLQNPMSTGTAEGKINMVLNLFKNYCTKKNWEYKNYKGLTGDLLINETGTHRGLVTPVLSNGVYPDNILTSLKNSVRKHTIQPISQAITCSFDVNNPIYNQNIGDNLYIECMQRQNPSHNYSDLYDQKIRKYMTRDNNLLYKYIVEYARLFVSCAEDLYKDDGGLDMAFILESSELGHTPKFSIGSNYNIERFSYTTFPIYRSKCSIVIHNKNNKHHNPPISTHFIRNQYTHFKGSVTRCNVLGSNLKIYQYHTSIPNFLTYPEFKTCFTSESNVIFLGDMNTMQYSGVNIYIFKYSPNSIFFKQFRINVRSTTRMVNPNVAQIYISEYDIWNLFRYNIPPLIYTHNNLNPNFSYVVINQANDYTTIKLQYSVRLYSDNNGTIMIEFRDNSNGNLWNMCLAFDELIITSHMGRTLTFKNPTLHFTYNDAVYILDKATLYVSLDIIKNDLLGMGVNKLVIEDLANYYQNIGDIQSSWKWSPGPVKQAIIHNLTNYNFALDVPDATKLSNYPNIFSKLNSHLPIFFHITEKPEHGFS